MSYRRQSPQPVVEGGTGAQTLTAHGVLLGEGTSAIVATTAGTNGQIIVGSTGADPAFITPTAGSGLAVTTNSTTLSYAISAPVSIANGGTNATSMATTDGVVYYDGTRLVTTDVGTAAQVLTSNGAGVAPTFQAAGGGGGLSSASVTLTSSQVKNLVTTPITLVAAPGVGKMILVYNAIAQLNYGGTNAFTNAGGGSLRIVYNGTAIGPIVLASSSMTATSNQIGQASTGFPSVASTSALNLALVVGQTTVTNFAGNAAGDNTIDVQVYYQVITP